MACGYAMFTNKLGVCWATAGPGAFNLFSGLASRCPIPIRCSPFRVIRRSTGAERLAQRNLGTQSHARFAGDVCGDTKKSWLLTDIDETMDVVEEAMNLAFEGRPGPVHIHVPENLTHHSIECDNYRDLRLAIAPVLPDPARVADDRRLLADALPREEGRALAGFGAIRSGAGPQVRRFIERYQIPLITTLDGKGIVDESHPLAIGVFSDSGHASAWKVFLEADVVIAIGNSQPACHLRLSRRPFDGKNAHPHQYLRTEIDKVYKADCAIVSDASPRSQRSPTPSSRRSGSGRRRRSTDCDYEAREIRTRRRDPPGPDGPGDRRMLPPRGIVLADAGAHLAWLGYYIELKEGQNFRKPGTLWPDGRTRERRDRREVRTSDRPVVACGDGSYLMAGFELMTAVQYDIPVIWVIFNDGEFKLIKLYQLSAFLESGLVEFHNPDYVAYASACGADGYRVDTLASSRTPSPPRSPRSGRA